MAKKKGPPSCRKCGAGPLKWHRTAKGKWMLVYPEGIITEGGETIITVDGHTKKDCDPGHFGFVSHWQKCPYANDFRKGGKSEST